MNFHLVIRAVRKLQALHDEHLPASLERLSLDPLDDPRMNLDMLVLSGSH